MKEIFIAGTRAWHVGQGDPLLVVHGGPGLDHEYLAKWLELLRRAPARWSFMISYRVWR